MRSVLICVLLTLFTKEDHVSGDVFRPTPIPLDEWRPYDSRGRAGTLHEINKPASSLTVVAIPPHYWEDALRHSVYLTLVRDKIDQLIAKGDTIEHQYNHNSHVSKEVDDQDLWDKIKAAPFDRIKEDETTTYGDVTILARGRLLEESEDFRFTEDDKTHEKCNDDQCMDGVKAFWSVKRIRQRDHEISPGKYHYELTFSIMSQIPKKQNKPYEHPIRTFTVQESTNNRVTESPQAYRNLEKSALQISRPERAIWFHKNIAPTPHQRKRKHQSELDRLFSSLFDYDDDDEQNYEEPKKYNQNTFQRPLPQFSNIVYGGGFSSEQQAQIKPLPYPYKPHNFKYQLYPFTTSSMGLIQQYSNGQETSGINNPHITQADYMSAAFNNIQISTRPAVLPTPLPPLVSTPKESFVKKSNTIKYNTSENVTNTFEMATNAIQYNKIKTPGKGNHFPEHLRPPIYNAPPGVFNMDKKPFKPMPPLKMPATKPLRTNRPVDFRPSPQVLDVQFSEPDPLFDTVFRPMTFGFAGNDNSTKNLSISKESENVRKKIQTPNSNSSSTFKKENNAKIHQHTTYTPEIITAHNSSEDEDVMEWADILSVFAKTTPMASHRSKNTTEQITTPLPSSTTTVTLVSTQITSDIPSTTAISTTRKLKKRTRPPPKFNKTENIKKHKSVTTTSSTTITTELPLTTINTDRLKGKKINQNLIPKATTTVTSTTKIPWKPSTKLTTTIPPSTTNTVTNTNPTNTIKITSTTKEPVEQEMISTPRSKNRNRFRQSTLIVKGTSVKHDRWSVTSPTPEKLRTALITSSIHTQRRKGSNFQGYVSSTPKNLDEEQNRHDHIDHGLNIVNTHEQKLSSPKIETLEKDINMVSSETPASKATGESSVDAEEQVISKEKKHYIYEESRDHTEYIFQNISDINNEVVDTEDILTTEKIISIPNPISKNKKCKKKHQNFSNKDGTQKILEKNESVNTNIPTMTLTTPSMLEDLLNNFSYDDLEQSKETIATTTKLDLNEEESETHGQYANDDLEKLLDSLNNDKYEEQDNEEYKNDEEDGQEDEDDDNEKESTYEDEDMSYQLSEDSYHHLNNNNDGKRPVSFLELIGME